MPSHLIRHGDTLWNIADHELGNPMRWKEIAELNRIDNPDLIFVGQTLQLPDMRRFSPNKSGEPEQRMQRVTNPAASVIANRRATTTLARSFLFIVADELNPFTKKLVRKVIFPQGIQNNPELVMKIMNPETYGFFPRDPNSSVSLGRHVLGRTDSKFISASELPFGSPRFPGKRYWIDVKKLEKSGAIIHDADDILADLTRISKKTKRVKDLDKIQNILHKSSFIDKEVCIEGFIPAKAVKGGKAMFITRGLQGVQVVGIVFTAIDIKNASVRSYEKGSIRPLAAETVRQVGGWGSAVIGAKLGSATGALLGIETGPFALATGAVGGLIGGVAGYFGFNWIAQYIDLEEEHE